MCLSIVWWHQSLSARLVHNWEAINVLGLALCCAACYNKIKADLILFFFFDEISCLIKLNLQVSIVFNMRARCICSLLEKKTSLHI